MKHLLLIFFCLSTQVVFTQDALNEQQLEDLSEADETESEDEFDLQQLQNLKRHPLNINDLSVSLSELPLLNALLIDNLISYRALLGEFISIYELQAVPGFTVDVIKAILPYITISDNEANVRSIKQRFKGGEHTMIIRPGVPSKTYFRYKYQYRNSLQYGALGEKDAGEKSLIDFYSFHLFVRNAGIIKSLALGDYVLNIGQGLIHWQSQAFKKTSSVINIKRQGELLRPYHSAGEYNFQRGAAITLKKGSCEATFFGSLRSLTTNIGFDAEYGEVITSINTSGLHRTPAELEDKNNASVASFGTSLKYLLARGHVAINGIRYMYTNPLLKRDEPYNLFAIKGSKWSNYSVDYAYTFRNFHFFGEMAASQNRAIAALSGLIATLHSSLDIAVIYRSIGQRYQSIYGNAFTESTIPSNEHGIYWGLSIKPNNNWKLDAYTDMFRFPWLRYRVDAPTYGRQHLVQLTWRPNKLVEVYSRFRVKAKPLNTESDHGRFPEDGILKNWRTHISFQLTRALLLRSRLELCWFTGPESAVAETGYLLYSDIVYKSGNRYSGSFRFQIFETGSYNTRLYAYENDVLFSSSTPLYYGKGLRSYINIRIRLRPHFMRGLDVDLGLKASVTVYHYADYQISTAIRPTATALKLQLFLSSYH